MADKVVTVRARMSAPGHTGSAAGQAGAEEFDILAITAGKGNGWQFSEAVLRGSLALWDGVECFVDHAPGARSVRDLAGVLREPAWDETAAGIRCKLRPVGPAGSLLAELGRQMLDDAVSPRVGFSADLVFTARGKQVEQVLRVLSVDVVTHPARGGKFVGETGSGQRKACSQERASSRPVIQSGATGTTLRGTGQKILPAGQGRIFTTMQQYQPTHKEKTMQQEEMQETTTQAGGSESPDPSAQAVRAALCGHLLESGLAAARLPSAAAERVRRQFAGRVFDPSELDAAIRDTRSLVAELTGAAAISGVTGGMVSAMFTSEDMVNAAVHDLLGTRRPEGLSAARPHRLGGIRELYTLMTGDTGFIGGYHPERAMFSTTVDLPGVLLNVLNKLIVQEWDELGRSGYRWWERVVAVEHFGSLQPITGVLVGEVTVLPAVSEGAAYGALPVIDSTETGAWGKYGGYIGLTLEMFERDETHRLRQYPRKLASAALRRISALVGSVFTANAGTGPVMSDGLNVFDAGHNNLGTAALTGATWEAASSAIYNQQMLVGSGGTAPRLALDARYLIVPRALRLAGRQILYPSFEREASIFSDNMQRGEPGDVITCPEFTDANDWAAAADPRLAPGIILGERFGVLPEIFIADNQSSGALFTNDEIRMKVRHWVSVFVADHRPLYKAKVA